MWSHLPFECKITLLLFDALHTLVWHVFVLMHRKKILLKAFNFSLPRQRISKPHQNQAFQATQKLRCDAHLQTCQNHLMTEAAHVPLFPNPYQAPASWDYVTRKALTMDHYLHQEKFLQNWKQTSSIVLTQLQKAALETRS